MCSEARGVFSELETRSPLRTAKIKECGFAAPCSVVSTARKVARVNHDAPNSATLLVSPGLRGISIRFQAMMLSVLNEKLHGRMTADTVHAAPHEPRHPTINSLCRPTGCRCTSATGLLPLAHERSQLKTFAELDLISPLQEALADQEYKTPTPIQAQTIAPAIRGRDILGIAQTGTGKTAAFSLPVLNRLGTVNRKAKPGRPIVLILAPTRELAIQIDESLANYGANLHLRTALVYGGVGQGKQVRQLQRGIHIVVATPGRLLDLMDQGHLSLDQLEIFVLDEADRMLDMGFLPDLKRIIRELPDDRQSLFFSATLPRNIVELANSLLYEPVQASLAPKRPAVEKIDQQMLFTRRSQKSDLLNKVLRDPDVYRAVVFTRTKRGADAVARRLDKQGIRAVAIHGNKSQNSRQRSLDAFRRNRFQVLVATDVAARGIDIDGVTHVINYDLPDEPESYIHRIGRTGRAGADGIAISFCSETDMVTLRAIEKFIGTSVPVHADFPPSEEHQTTDPQSHSSGKRASKSKKHPRKTRSSGRSAKSGLGTNDPRANRGGSRTPNAKQTKPASNQKTSSHKKTATGINVSEPQRTNQNHSESSEGQNGDHQNTRSKRARKKIRQEKVRDSQSQSKISGQEKPKRRKSRKQREDRVDFKRGPGTKKKRKVKGSTSNNRTTPQPIAKNAAQKSKKTKKSKRGAAARRQSKT